MGDFGRNVLLQRGLEVPPPARAIVDLFLEATHINTNQNQKKKNKQQRSNRNTKAVAYRLPDPEPTSMTRTLLGTAMYLQRKLKILSPPNRLAGGPDLFPDIPDVAFGMSGGFQIAAQHTEPQATTSLNIKCDEHSLSPVDQIFKPSPTLKHIPSSLNPKSQSCALTP